MQCSSSSYEENSLSFHYCVMAAPQNLVTCHLDSIFKHRHKNGMMSALTCSKCPQLQTACKKRNKTQDRKWYQSAPLPCTPSQ